MSEKVKICAPSFGVENNLFLELVSSDYDPAFHSLEWKYLINPSAEVPLKVLIVQLEEYVRNDRRSTVQITFEDGKMYFIIKII